MLQVEENLETMAAILTIGSEQAKLIRQQKGRDAGLEYLEQIMKEVLVERDHLIEEQQQATDR